MMMRIAFITFNSSLLPLIEGLCSSNPWEFEGIWERFSDTCGCANTHTAYCNRSVISPITKLHRLSISLCHFSHVPLERNQLDWDWRIRLNWQFKCNWLYYLLIKTTPPPQERKENRPLNKSEWATRYISTRLKPPKLAGAYSLTKKEPNKSDIQISSDVSFLSSFWIISQRQIGKWLFFWIRYTPKTHKIEALGFLSILRYKFKLKFQFNLNL